MWLKKVPNPDRGKSRQKKLYHYFQLKDHFYSKKVPIFGALEAEFQFLENFLSFNSYI